MNALAQRLGEQFQFFIVPGEKITLGLGSAPQGLFVGMMLAGVDSGQKFVEMGIERRETGKAGWNRQFVGAHQCFIVVYLLFPFIAKQ